MNRRGFTLIEMVIVIVIIGIISTIALRSIQGTIDQARFDDTVKEMNVIARAILGDERLVSGGVRSDFGYVGDVGSLPTNLDALVTRPSGFATWAGPYFSSDFAENSQDHLRDAWNDPYAYSGGLTIISAGGGNTITRRLADTITDLTSNTVNGIVRDKSLAPPGDSAAIVVVTIEYPDGAGSLTSSSIAPNASGEFSFANSIPIGLHRIQAVAGADTISKKIAVYPARISYLELRFPSDLW